MTNVHFEGIENIKLIGFYNPALAIQLLKGQDYIFSESNGGVIKSIIEGILYNMPQKDHYVYLKQYTDVFCELVDLFNIKPGGTYCNEYMFLFNERKHCFLSIKENYKHYSKGISLKYWADTGWNCISFWKE